MDISQIDSNFKVETTITESDIRFFDVRQEPFKVYGVTYDDGQFRRLPEKLALSVSKGVHFLHTDTAGGRVRFKTDSRYVAINVKMKRIGKMPHFALTGSVGFDLYVREEEERYIGSFPPPFNITDGYEKILYFDSEKLREITINFPLYSSITELYIGLSEGAELLAPTPYKMEKPIVYYGSSITQGGCASRPGNSYESVISRRFDTDYINLGFSGNAKGEREIYEYIANMDMSLFVYDYDHNAPSVEHLRNTHEDMFKAVREKNPELPIVIMSRPKYYLTPNEEERLEIIKKTYNNALENGDKNVYFLSGRELMQIAGNEGTVDNCHPNDLGFFSMARVLGDLIEKILF